MHKKGGRLVVKRRRGLLILFLILCFLLPAAPTEAAAKYKTQNKTENKSESQVRVKNKNPAYKNKLKKIGGKIYYYNSRGELVKKHWRTIGDKRYYFTKTGAAAAGPAKVNGIRYLFSSRGVLRRNGVYKYNGNTYYVNARGKIQTGWKKINNNLYFFDNAGILRKNQWVRYGDNLYYVNSTGALQKNRWIQYGNNLYYVNSAGVLQKNRWIRYGSNTYYVNSAGVLQKNCWIKVGNHIYHVDSAGALQKNQWIDGRYVGENGVYDPDKKDLTVLKTKMEDSIRSYRGSWSVYMKNLETGQYFSINNRKIYAASLIKLYAMGAVYSRIAQGKISESSVSSTISSMITVSDNTSFNTIVRKVGLTYINQWCRENGYTETNQGHGLSPSSNNYGLNNGTGSNVTSVADCGKFLESVYRGTCVSAAASQKMLGYLKRQQRRSKIPAGVPGGVVVANKTGETDNYTHDATIVYSKNATYILVVMGSTPGSGWSSAGNITSLSRMAYNYLNP